MSEKINYKIILYRLHNFFSELKGVFTLSRVCAICNKGVSTGMKVSHSHIRSKRTWAPNLQKVKAIVNGTPKKLNVCTRCLRSGKVQRAV